MVGYSVYLHTCPNNKKYIGVTSALNPEERWHNGKGYSKQPRFYRAIIKYGWDNIEHQILHYGLTAEQAEQKEIEYIHMYKSNDRQYGYNTMPGGILNRPHSEDTKKKISKTMKDTKVFSVETRSKISESKMGTKHHHAKPVLQMDRHGNIIREWQYSRLAAITLGIKASSISACARNTRPSAGGFIWSYPDNVNPLIAKKNPSTILQYDLNMNLVGKYDSTKEIAEHFSTNYRITKNKISLCCTGKQKTYQGHIWKREGS